MFKTQPQLIDYIPSQDKYQCFELLLNQNWSILLDSGEVMPAERNTNSELYKRFDILVNQPCIKISFANNTLQISQNDNTTLVETNRPLENLRELLRRHQIDDISEDDLGDIPFRGGLLGYISYDFGKEYLSSNAISTCGQQNAIDDLQIPGIKMGLYQWALITDHQYKTTTIYNFGLAETDWLARVETIKSSINQSRKLHSKSDIKEFSADQSFQQYASSFEKIKAYIDSGDCYQINYAQRFQTSYEGEIFSIYKKLALANNSPFSSFMRFEDFQILSLSPERFIAVNNKQVITQPIKGTLPRKFDPLEDRQQAENLVKSIKDRAENLMIVDLLRNDLSRTAATSSVEVTELFGHYRFESVHHLISTIESRLAPQFDVFDLLQTTLPGGSITGAPKIRAMQIIDELEPVKRGIYCGIIAYIDFRGKMDSNICIRTLVAKNNKLYCWAGGGLVSDSNLESEYQETYDKLNKILPVLNEQPPVIDDPAREPKVV